MTAKTLTETQMFSIFISVAISLATIGGVAWAVVRPAASQFVKQEIDAAGLAKMHLVGSVEEKIKDIEEHIEKQENESKHWRREQQKRDEKKSETLQQLQLDVQRGLIQQQTILELLRQNAASKTDNRP